MTTLRGAFTSIESTTAAGIALCAATVLLLGQFAIDRLIAARLQQNFDQALLAKARALVTLTKFDGKQVELHFADEFMPEFEAEQPEYFELFMEDGRLLERSNSFFGRLPSRFAPPAAPVSFTDLTLPDGRPGRQVVVDFIPQIEDKPLRAEFPDAEREHSVLRVARERESLDRSLLELHLLLAAIGIGSIAATTLVVVLGMRLGLRPLAAMQREIAGVGAASIDRRLSAGGPRELEPIALQFNHVLDELEQAFRREREFSSNVAHELRTPVAELRAFAEVALKWPDERDIGEFYEHVLQASRHLDVLVANLLHLARADSNQVSAAPVPTDVGALVGHVWGNLASTAAGREILLDQQLAGLPALHTDATWLRLILENLLGNAIAYSPRGSRVSCGWRVNGRGYVLCLGNPAGQTSRADLPFVFDRFWRSDLARSGGQHVGIGLSLVRSYSRILLAEVSAEIEQGEFRISLGPFRAA